MYQTSTTRTRARARRLLQHKADKEVSPKLGDIHGCRLMAVTQGLRIWSKGWSVGSSRNPTKHGRKPFDGATHFPANIRRYYDIPRDVRSVIIPLDLNGS